MTIDELHAELSAFAELLADRIAEKLTATLPDAMERAERRRGLEALRAQARGQAEQDRFLTELSLRQERDRNEAERKREERKELERTIDFSLLTEAERLSFVAGGPEPLDYSERAEAKRLEREERELVTPKVSLLSDDEAEIYFTRHELPADYRQRALRAREEQRQSRLLADALDHDELMTPEERTQFRLEGIIPPDFEARLEIAKKTGSPNAGANVPKVRL